MSIPDAHIVERPYSVLSEDAMTKVVSLFQVKLQGYCSWSPVQCRRKNIKALETAQAAAVMLYQIACEDMQQGG